MQRLTLKRIVHLIVQARDLLWHADVAALSRLRRWGVITLRMVYAVGRDLAEGELTLRAMSLVYTTLLSLAPLLALSFSVLKGFGVHNQLRPALLTLLAPLGSQGVDIANQVIGFVENIRVGVLGAFGLGFLVYTVVTLLQKVEQALNFVWRVERRRPFAQRFGQYLSVLMIGPLLIFSAVGVTAAFFRSKFVQGLVGIAPLGTLIELATTLLPYVFVIAAFAFVYVLMPNTRVRVGSALLGATVAGVLWQTLGWGFALFIAGSTKYTAIYAGFAIVIFSMIWLYLNWLIVLIGGSIAFYHQYPAQLGAAREPKLSNRVKEKLALLMAALIGQHYYGNQPAWPLEALAARLGVPLASAETVLEAMLRNGFVTETADQPPRYLPARSFETITVKQLLDAVRAAEEQPSSLSAEKLPREPEIESLLGRIDASVEESLHGRTLRQLALSGLPAKPAARPHAAEP